MAAHRGARGGGVRHDVLPAERSDGGHRDTVTGPADLGPANAGRHGASAVFFRNKRTHGSVLRFHALRQRWTKTHAS